MYWENFKNNKRPVYLDLCLSTIIKYCSSDFNIIVLNEKTVFDYLPNIRRDIKKLKIALKVDYIRLKLLYKYGGVWLDFDTILLKSLKPLYNKLDSYDFIGFGCTGRTCNNGYPRPSNALLISKKGTVLFKNCINQSDKLLDNAKKNDDYNFKYFDLGKKIIWNEIEKLTKDGYEYLHFDSSYTGNRDNNKRWITQNRLLGKNVIFLNPSNLYCVFLYNSDLSKDENKWFLKLNEYEIMISDTVVGKLFRKSLL